MLLCAFIVCLFILYNRLFNFISPSFSGFFVDCFLFVLTYGLLSKVEISIFFWKNRMLTV